MELVLKELGWTFRDESLERGPGSKCYVAPAPGTHGIRVKLDQIAQWDSIPLEKLPLHLDSIFWEYKGFTYQGVEHVILPYLHKRMELGV